MSETVDVRASMRVLRRRARWIVLPMVAGALLGGAYAVLSPPAYTGTAVVLLPPSATSSNGTSIRQIDTELRIAKSNPVLAAAGKQFTPALSAKEVAGRIKVSGPTDDLVQVTGHASNAATAAKIANAVANSYIAYSIGAIRSQSSAVLGQLESQAAALSGQLSSLQQELAATTKRIAAEGQSSAAGTRDAALLGTLTAEQANTSLQLDQVRASIQTMTPQAAAAGSGTSSTTSSPTAPPQLLQAAGNATRSSAVVWIAEAAAAGALLAGLLAAVVLIAFERRDPRPRTRDEIATAVGAPVVGSLNARSRKDVSGWSELLTSYPLSPVEEWALRRTLRLVGPGANQPELGTSVLILSLAEDLGAMSLAPLFAVAAAASGVNTALVPPDGVGSAASFTAACRHLAGEFARERLRVEATLEDELRRQRDEFVISVVVVDPMQPRVAELPPATTVLLSLTAGRASADDLARVAVAVENQGFTINGVLVADPAPDDKSAGRLPGSDAAPVKALPTLLPGTVALRRP